MSSSQSQISEGRQVLYYIGMALTGIGMFLFLSVFVSGCQAISNFGRPPRPVVWVSPGAETIPRGMMGIPENAEVRVGSPSSSIGDDPFSSLNRARDGAASFATRAISGMALMMLGSVLMGLGRAGLRGSGVILDPHGAREDLKPWNQAAGGMLDDTLAASPIVTRAVENLGNSGASPSAPHIRVRCLKCRVLNDEDAKFCDECGAALR